LERINIHLLIRFQGSKSQVLVKWKGIRIEIFLYRDDTIASAKQQITLTTGFLVKEQQHFFFQRRELEDWRRFFDFFDLPTGHDQSPSADLIARQCSCRA